MFTKDNTVDATDDQIATLNDELKAILSTIDPNDYEARQAAEQAFRDEVAGRPDPGPAPPMHGRPIEHEAGTQVTEPIAETGGEGHVVVPSGGAEGEKAADDPGGAEAKHSEDTPPAAA